MQERWISRGQRLPPSVRTQLPTETSQELRCQAALLGCLCKYAVVASFGDWVKEHFPATGGNLWDALHAGEDLHRDPELEARTVTETESNRHDLDIDNATMTSDRIRPHRPSAWMEGALAAWPTSPQSQGGQQRSISVAQEAWSRVAPASWRVHRCAGQDT